MKHCWILLPALLFSCAQIQCKPDLTTAEKPEIFADSVNRAQLIGKWLGESNVSDGSKVRELIDRHADGTFVVYFHFAENGKDREQTEAGYWGISGGIYFTLTRTMKDGARFVPVNVKDPTYYDAYKALSLSPSEFVYKSLASGEQFSVKRVGEDSSSERVPPALESGREPLHEPWLVLNQAQLPLHHEVEHLEQVVVGAACRIEAGGIAQQLDGVMDRFHG
jgi:hypothetical protein